MIQCNIACPLQAPNEGIAQSLVFMHFFGPSKNSSLLLHNTIIEQYPIRETFVNLCTNSTVVAYEAILVFFVKIFS